MKKQIAAITMILVFAVSGAASANHGGHDGFSLKEKCYKKLDVLMMCGKQIKLTEEQLQTLKDKKFEIMRQHIQLESQMALVALDIKKQLMADAPNQIQIDALIDNKVELKRTLMKAFAKTIVDVKALLTPEQRAQMKEMMWSGCKGGKCAYSKKHHQGEK